MNIEFVIPTYDRMDHLMCIISSIRAQIVPNWKIHVVSDCSPPGILDKIINFFAEDERIKFTIFKDRSNDWGHTPRNYGLRNATEEWVVMTGEDNYYTPIFVQNFLKVIDGNTNFVYCDMIHNAQNYAKYFESKPVLNHIDIGNFATRSIFAKQLHLDREKYGADGIFVEEYIQKFCPSDENIKKINRALYIHN